MEPVFIFVLRFAFNPVFYRRNNYAAPSAMVISVGGPPFAFFIVNLGF
jgi:hypothetical protein